MMRNVLTVILLSAALALTSQSCSKGDKMIEPTIETGSAGENTENLYYYPGMQVYLKSPEFFSERLAEVADAGFKYIEIKLKYAIKYNELSDDEIRALFSSAQRDIKERGVKVWSIHLPYGDKTWTNIGGEEEIRRQSVDLILRVLGFCKEYFPECRNYVLHPSQGVLKPRERTTEQCRKSLEEMLPVAKSLGVRLCIENMVGGLAFNTDEKGAVIEGFDDVRTTFDLGHANCSGNGKDVVEFLAWEGTNLGTVHIHDNMGILRKDEHLLAGTGSIRQWGEIYRTLLNVNRYRGVFMFEPKDDQSAADVMASYNMIVESYKNLKAPEPAGNMVVAHRGGSLEAGVPDNSIAALDYAISLGCMASECDIYWTKDNDVIVAHADGKCMINGMHPWEHTIAEIKAAGKLSNGEEIPTLREYLEHLIEKSRCTKLWLDIKIVDSPEILPEYPTRAALRSCEIIKEMNAGKYVEFICTSLPTVMSEANAACRELGIPIGWMAYESPEKFVENGYDWANLGFYHMKDGFEPEKIDAYVDAGIEFSVYTVDRPELMDIYIGYADRLSAITTNYPAKLLEKMQ